VGMFLDVANPDACLVRNKLDVAAFFHSTV